MGVDQKVTFCRICEAHCGMVATVQDGQVTKLRPDAEHPLSSGYACPKGIAMLDVQNDPDRVTHPLRRRADGDGFERVSWEDALADIGRRLRDVRDRYGGEAIGWYMGNPGAFSHSHPLWVKGFLDALASRHYYTAVLAGRGQPLRRLGAAIRVGRSCSRSPTSSARSSCSWSARTHSSPTAACSPLRASRTSSTRSSPAAGASSWSTRAAPRPRAPTSTSPSGPTPTPGCSSPCCT